MVVEITGNAVISDKTTYGTLEFSGQVKGLDKPYSLGLSYARYSDYISGVPNWKENYSDGKGAYVEVSNSTPYYSRTMSDANKYNDYCVYVTVREGTALGIVAERFFRVQYPNVVVPVTVTLTYKSFPEPPPVDEKTAAITVLAGGLFAGLLYYLVARNKL